MNSYSKTFHQQKQIEVIDKIERQVNTDSIEFSTVTPTKDYGDDLRICLTSVHFPDKKLLNKIKSKIINPLRKIQPDHYYYPKDSLHLTVKNVRTIEYPPNFNQEDIKKVRKVFVNIIPKHHQFETYFYRLLLFPSNLALIGTTDPELDKIILDLNNDLGKINFSDDKQYTNKNYFFCNMTLVRFVSPVSKEFRKKVIRLSASIKFDPYIIDSVTLLSGNAVLQKKEIFGVWSLPAL